MRRWIGSLFAALIMALSISSTALAGSWQHDMNGWWYLEDDGSYAKDGWKWIDGNGDGIAECYYFTHKGYLVDNQGKVDGYETNRDGAWVVDGVVQTKDVSEPNDPEALALLTAVVQKSDETDAFDADVKMTMVMNTAGESGTMTMDINMKAKELTGEIPVYVMDGTMTVEGETDPVPFLTFCKDGYTYVDMAGVRYKQKAEPEEAKKSTHVTTGSSDLSSVSGLKMREEGGKKILTYEMRGSEMNEAMKQSAGGLSELMGLGVDYRYQNGSGEYTIDENNNLIAEKAHLEMDMTIAPPEGVDEGPLTVGYVIDMEVTINKTGDSVKLSFPPTDGYEDVTLGEL